jgi:phosphatidylglycerol:prolipoprotein diacylglycerol transferase
MMPLLFQIGPIPIRTYGFFFACAFYVANSLILKLSAVKKMPPKTIADLVFFTFLVGILGARLMYILTQLPEFMAHPWTVFEYWSGGFVFFGGFLAAVPYVIWFCKKHQLPLWAVLDIATLGLVLAHAIGRLGCFSAGCCYGKPTSSFLGVRFSSSEIIDHHLRYVPVHPTQLYESFSLMILFFVLFQIWKKSRFDGQLSFVYLFTYPVIRSVIEIFRGDLQRGFVFGTPISTSQFFSFCVFFVGFVTFMIRFRASASHASR